MTDLLLQEFPELPAGSQTPRAVVMRSKYEYDDNASHIPSRLRGHIPDSRKNNGKFHIYKNEEGFLYNTHPDGQWGIALFIRKGVHFHVVLPLNFITIGNNFRTLREKQQDNQSNTPQSAVTDIEGTNKLQKFARAFWSALRQDQNSLFNMKMNNDRYNDVFANSVFHSNVDGILAGIVPEAQHFLKDGNFGLQDLMSLPEASTYRGAGQFIYVILYLNLDGGDEVGLYIGQTNILQKRLYQHRSQVDQGSSTPHYSIARKAEADDRHMRVLWYRDNQQPKNPTILDMAEQTMIVILDTYNSWITNSNSNLISKPEFQLMHEQCAFLQLLSGQVRNITGWQQHLDVDIRGCNSASPLFHSMRSPIIDCFRVPELGPESGSYTVYRRPCSILHPTAENRPKMGARSRASLPYFDDDGNAHVLLFTCPEEVFKDSPPESGHLIFEIMDGRRSHSHPWYGCPSVGPFRNFDDVSCLGIRMEWYDVSSNRWATVQLCHKGGTRRTTSDMLLGWRRAYTIIQLLEGITWIGPLNGLQKNAHLGARRVMELTVDHLQQTCQWIPRRTASSPAPTLASWGYNFQLMANQFGYGKTIICREQPPIEDDFWFVTTGDLNRRKPGKIRCDFCKYTWAPGANTCVRDETRDDIWVCKPCSEMNRPCTFTPISVSIELWGSNPPVISHVVWSRFPDGPHKKLAFHNPLSPAEQRMVSYIQEPFGGHSASIALGIALELQADDESNVDTYDIDPEEDQDDEE
ncbi:hypothetical protein H9Q71_013127 [Fusarium xylarioides]|nr:hypothetical protein H9Q71_013127 [Fusarium xylarioides]